MGVPVDWLSSVWEASMADEVLELLEIFDFNFQKEGAGGFLEFQTNILILMDDTYIFRGEGLDARKGYFLLQVSGGAIIAFEHATIHRSILSNARTASQSAEFSQKAFRVQALPAEHLWKTTQAEQHL